MLVAPPNGGGSPFVLKLFYTISDAVLKCYKFWGSAPKKGETAP